MTEISCLGGGVSAIAARFVSMDMALGTRRWRSVSSIHRGRRISTYDKATSDEGVVMMNHECASRVTSKLERFDRRLDLRPKLWKGIEKGGDKHVTGPASDRIKMNIQETLRLAAAGR
jgi:hypothetical protein